MAEVNLYGLSRYIPADVRREVRRRSKFGCVVCRNGFYQYEHIDPPFESAATHEPDRICCLCASCHDSVTRGQLSKAMVKAAYLAIASKPTTEVSPPFGPLDFHDGKAELVLGGLLYSPAVQTVLSYHGHDLIKVVPGRAGEPGLISAVFTDDDGTELLELEENAWIGSLETWDIEVVGPRITVRRKQGKVTLQLRLDPPGRIIVERLDMRIGDAHVLATENAYAAGRYFTDGSIWWVSAEIRIRRGTSTGAAIEFTDSSLLEIRDEVLRERGQSLATPDRQIVAHSDAGVMVKHLGIVIASLCGAFDLFGLSTGPQPLEAMRRVIVGNPESLPTFISTGKLTQEAETATISQKTDPQT